MTGDEGGFVAGEEERGGGDVARLAGPAHGLRFGPRAAHAIELLGVCSRAPVGQRGHDEPRADAVDPHVVLGKFQRDRFGQLDHGRLRHAVEMLAAIEIRGDARGADDAAAALALHDRRGVFEAQKHALQQHIEREIEILDAGALDGAERTAEARIVVQAVEPAPGADGHVEHGAHVVFLAHVRLDETRGFAQRFSHGAAVRAQVGDHHARAFRNKTARRFGTDAAARAGDHRNFVVESSHADCAL